MTNRYLKLGQRATLQSQKQLDALLLPNAQALLTEWCGAVEVQGQEIVMANPLRTDETLGSFKFNASSGAWGDFAMPDFRGRGLVALYAAVKSVPVSDAIQALQDRVSATPALAVSRFAVPKREKPKVQAVDLDSVIKAPDLHPDLGFPVKTWDYLDREGKLSFQVHRFEQDGKKETRPVAWSAQKNAWLWQYPTPPYPLYGLQNLLARPQARVVVTEGEKAADAAAGQFPDDVVVTSACGSEQALRSDWSWLKGRRVVIAPDKDEPGRHYALAVAGAALVHEAESVSVLDVWRMASWATGDDLADHEVGPEFLDAAQSAADFFTQAELEPHVIKAAATLGRGDLDRRTDALSAILGVKARTLASLVKDAKPSKSAGDGEKPTNSPFTDVLEPSEEEVDGDALLDEIVALINRYVILTPSQAVSVACWVVFSYGFESMRICPQLLINSPAKRCGKSTLLELIVNLSLRPLAASNISSAAIYRAIEAWKPTLLIDEADTFLGNKASEDIAGILNSGHNRGLAFVIRTTEVDGEHVPKSYSTFCPKVIAMIKAPADTIIDRSIVIRLERKLPTQRVDALAVDGSEQMRGVRSRILRWTNDYLQTVKFEINATPPMTNDRARQNWAVMVAFAQALGPKSLAAVLDASREVANTAVLEEDHEGDLLTDIQELVVREKGAHIQSATLVKELGKMAHRPWIHINRGKALTESGLAQMLKPFGARPAKYRDGKVTLRGYEVCRLKEVFLRYLSPVVDA